MVVIVVAPLVAVSFETIVAVLLEIVPPLVVIVWSVLVVVVILWLVRPPTARRTVVINPTAPRLSTTIVVMAVHGIVGPETSIAVCQTLVVFILQFLKRIVSRVVTSYLVVHLNFLHVASVHLVVVCLSIE